MYSIIICVERLVVEWTVVRYRDKCGRANMVVEEEEVGEIEEKNMNR